MKHNIVCLVLLFQIVHCKFSIDISVASAGESKSDVTISTSNIDVKVVDDEDIKLFGIEDRNLRAAVKEHFGKKPNGVYLKSPTPWGDLYKIYKWEQVSRVLTVKAAKVRNVKNNQQVLLRHEFENAFNETIKVNTGITQAVENTITTSWSKNNEIEVSQEVEYDVNVVFAKLAGSTSFSYTTAWGRSEEISKSVTMGTSTNVETELKPGQAATAVLTANQGFVEIEVTYMSKLRGNVAVNFKKEYKGHHFWGPPIESVMKDANISNEIKRVEVIQIGFYTDATLKVFDTKTKLPL